MYVYKTSSKFLGMFLRVEETRHESDDNLLDKFFGCHDTRHNDIQHIDTQFIDTQHIDTQHIDTQHTDAW